MIVMAWLQWQFLAEKSRAGHTAEVKKILAAHGADKLSDLDKPEYASGSFFFADAFFFSGSFTSGLEKISANSSETDTSFSPHSNKTIISYQTGDVKKQV